MEGSELSVRRTLQELRIHRSTFYSWYRRYLEQGAEGLGPKKPKEILNFKTGPQKMPILNLAMIYPNLYY